ncbi:MAG: rhomboid protease GlpG [Humisphaera sp.]|nr:rhomboid protease GlpG [Humisphaera sp.]
MVGTIPSDTDAERFSDYLVTQQIGNMVEESASGDWVVWIEKDDQIDRGKSELQAFLQNPADPKYGAATRHAESIRKQQEQKLKKKRTEYVDVRTRWGRPSQWNAPLTLTLIALSCVISVGTLSILGLERSRQQAVDLFTFTSVFPPGAYEKWQTEHNVETIFQARTGYWLEHLKRGQVWRLITPIFIHWSVLHLIFNMFWMRDLGGMIELQRGTRVLLPLVLACAILPNIAQYYHHGPSAFGGMSGVVYGLFGYVWIKGRYQPHLGLGINQQSATIMIAWLFLCMTGLVGPVANTAHVAGLLVGAAIAYAPVARQKIRKKAQTR